MFYVVDLNLMRNSELMELVRAEPGLNFVLLDAAFVEMCKHEKWEQTMRGSLAPLGRRPAPRPRGDVLRLHNATCHRDARADRTGGASRLGQAGTVAAAAAGPVLEQVALADTGSEQRVALQVHDLAVTLGGTRACSQPACAENLISGVLTQWTIPTRFVVHVSTQIGPFPIAVRGPAEITCLPSPGRHTPNGRIARNAHSHELRGSPVPALSAYAYQKAVSLVPANTAGP